ncbi:Dihydroorotate dehydrogenase 1 [Heterobasidion irregulare TC 32-1]|uniref:Dihydroorotate dehydrogenase (quinone), mitochondrial n=1 Tax=Heterobasidion irregulare (strain TC 32-1) TaxID=747525 RepID=W4JZ51_HETIT|nr:Dihydroorotate dehydrogenase 1 [Heterobasidion irregulare TC 32-1]ETW78812.1 Dihydroorotate dehydrogenase 1 [Heterobasidion irregulare TC 32-1]
MATLRLASRHLVPLRHRALSTSAPSQSNRFRSGAFAAVVAVSTGLFAVYYFDSRSALHRYVLTPALRYALDAETGHRLAVRVLGTGLGPRDQGSDDERLRAELWGMELSNPVGIAAGFDKDGEAIDGLFGLGFSWVEVGSITPKPQPGNPRPRVFHLPEDSALINRYGFPSQGHASVLARLRARIPAFSSSNPEESPASLHPDKMLAVNLGKNKASAVDSPDDFVAGVHTFAPYADVLVVNVSSPNTPGLRGLQQRGLLEGLLKNVTQARDEASKMRARKPKIVLKIAPDLSSSEIEDVADTILLTGGIDGVIVSNTTIQRPASLVNPAKVEAGGLSGAPLKAASLTAVRTLRARLPSSIPLIGCGGIASGADALEFARAGASFVQVYTSFGYDGAGAPRRIKDELAAQLKAEGTTWSAVVQTAVDGLSLKEEQGGSGVGLLIRQAEELKGLLDSLGEKMAREEVESSVEPSAAVSAPSANP